jgi:hypothetical protein
MQDKTRFDFLSGPGFFGTSDKLIGETSKENVQNAIKFYQDKGQIVQALQYAEKLCILDGYLGFTIYFPLKLEKILKEHQVGETVDIEASSLLAYINFVSERIMSSDKEKEFKAQFLSQAEAVKQQLMLVIQEDGIVESVLDWTKNIQGGFPTP